MNTTRSKTERKRVSLPPGTLVYVGDVREGPAHLRMLRYNGETIERAELPPDTIPSRVEGAITWLQIEGVHEVDVVRRIGERYALHMLALEDIVNTLHRAKLEEYDNMVFVILKDLRDDGTGALLEDNISLVLQRDAVLSFSGHSQTTFDPIHARVESANGRFRRRGADYLFYTLLDAVVDHYVAIIESTDDMLGELEDEVLMHPTRASMHRLHALRRRLLILRRAVLPLREAIIQLVRNEDHLISDDVLPFLRDVQDHLAMVLENIDHGHDVLSGLLDLSMSHESYRMNEVMKVLTMIATIFIPLTFIAGVYGMNFRHMPELAWPWAYPGVLLLMLGVTLALLHFFRRKRWL